MSWIFDKLHDKFWTMKTKIFSLFFLVVFIVSALVIAQEKKAPPEDSPDSGKIENPKEPVNKEPVKKEDVKQKITTPPLQLSEEEDIKIEETITEKPSVDKKTKPKPKTKAEKPNIKATAKTPKDQGKQEEIIASSKPLKTKSRIELVLDASGSMNGLMGQTTKMALLKSAIDEIIGQPLPEGAEREIGLRVYGSQKAASEGDCKDTELLLPIEPLDKKLFKSKVDSITAMGVSPIGHALQEAANDFNVSTDVDNIIILVADGTDSCKANICELAQKLHTDPKKIMIHVLGFDLDANAEADLRCVAKNSDGQFSLARNDNELTASLDQLLMANVPYNLRVKVVSGATPLPSNLKVYRSGTKRIVREDDTTGIKYYQLQPGTYDIEVSYKDSIERPGPSKLIKRIEVQATSKAEQIVQFDLGMLTLEAFDPKDAPIGATYVLRKKEDPKILASIQTPPGPHTIWLTEGTYSAKVQATTQDNLKLTGQAEGLKIEKGGSLTHDFRFQVGKVKLLAKDTKGEPIPFRYWVSESSGKKKEKKDVEKVAKEPEPKKDADKKDKVKDKTIFSGKSTAEGTVVDLPPTTYDISFALYIEGLSDLPKTIVDNITVVGGEQIEKVVELPTSTITLIGKDSKGEAVETLFTIKPNVSEEKPAEFKSEKVPVTLVLPPERYDIDAVFLNSEFTPAPKISWEAMVLTPNQVIEKEALFRFGQLTLFGKNSKSIPINSAFYIYNVGGKEPVVTLTNITSPTDVRLTESIYDIKAEDLTGRNDPKPSVWFHNVEIKHDTPARREAIFTHGKLKMICRGPNNVTLECDYRLFSYGMDSPLFEGATEERWREFDMPPGNYYIEAGYHDIKDEVLLKKWISISIKDNEMLEQIIRF